MGHLLVTGGAGSIGATFAQQNMSFSGTRGTTRCIHAEPWDTDDSVVTGRVFGVWVDLREGPGFGAVVAREITPATAVPAPRYRAVVNAAAFTAVDAAETDEGCGEAWVVSA